MNANQSRALRMLMESPHRSIYEGGDAAGKGSGLFYVDYSDGRSPTMTRVEVEELAAAGWVAQEPQCSGLYKATPKIFSNL